MMHSTEIKPIFDEFRNMVSFLKLIEDNSVYAISYKCFNGNWDIKDDVKKNIDEIKRKIFRKDRGRKCPMFSAYDKDATLEAVLEISIIKREVIDRKKTRFIAVVAMVVSVIATLIASILPQYLSGNLSFP